MTIPGVAVIQAGVAGKTLTFAAHFLPNRFANYLWAKLSTEFVAGASSATIFLLDAGIKYESIFFQYELWVLLENGIERAIQFVGG
jgi:hypothetical protein